MSFIVVRVAQSVFYLQIVGLISGCAVDADLDFPPLFFPPGEHVNMIKWFDAHKKVIVKTQSEGCDHKANKGHIYVIAFFVDVFIWLESTLPCPGKNILPCVVSCSCGAYVYFSRGVGRRGCAVAVEQARICFPF